MQRVISGCMSSPGRECQNKHSMQDALEAVRLALVKRWPNSKVHLFGSTANQLSICNNNDIDVCLELPDLQTDTVRFLWPRALPRREACSRYVWLCVTVGLHRSGAVLKDNVLC